MDANGSVEPLKKNSKAKENTIHKNPADHPHQEEPSKPTSEKIDVNNEKSGSEQDKVSQENSNNLVQKIFGDPTDVEVPVEPEEPIQEAGKEKSNEQDEETKLFGEYSIIDIKTEFPEIYKTEVGVIPEVDEGSNSESTDINGTKVENTDPEGEKDDLNSSFEIVHYHDIKLIEYGYLTRETVTQ